MIEPSGEFLGVLRALARDLFFQAVDQSGNSVRYQVQIEVYEQAEP
jgi:hypothetical protein